MKMKSIRSVHANLAQFSWVTEIKETRSDNKNRRFISIGAACPLNAKTALDLLPSLAPLVRPPSGSDGGIRVESSTQKPLRSHGVKLQC